MSLAVRQQTDRQILTPAPESGAAGGQGVQQPRRPGENRPHGTQITGKLDGVEKAAKHHRIGLVRFVQREQDRIAVLLQPIRQPQYGIVPSLEPTLSKIPGMPASKVFVRFSKIPASV